MVRRRAWHKARISDLKPHSSGDLFHISDTPVSSWALSRFPSQRRVSPAPTERQEMSPTAELERPSIRMVRDDTELVRALTQLLISAPRRRGLDDLVAAVTWTYV